MIVKTQYPIMDMKEPITIEVFAFSKEEKNMIQLFKVEILPTAIFHEYQNDDTKNTKAYFNNMVMITRAKILDEVQEVKYIQFHPELVHEYDLVDEHQRAIPGLSQ
jgi:hypothetical protein